MNNRQSGIKKVSPQKVELREFIDRVKEANPLEDVVLERVKRSNSEIPLGSYIKVLCPFHDDHDPSLIVWKDIQYWKCYPCNDSGDVIDFIQKFGNCDFLTAVRILCERANIPFDVDISNEGEKYRAEKKLIEDILLKSAQYYHSKLDDKVTKILHERYGLTDETISKLLIGFADCGLYDNLKGKGYSDDNLLKSGLFVKVGAEIGDFYQKRIVFPYWKSGKIVYSIGRRIDGVTPDDKFEKAKYKKQQTHDRKDFVSEFIRNDHFYGEDTIRGADEILITEGVTDCIIAIQTGFSCISPVTTTFRKSDAVRLTTLTSRAKTVYICNDSEVNEEGFKGAIETAKILEENGIRVEIIQLPRGEEEKKVDLNDFLRSHTKKEFEELKEKSIALVEYELRLCKHNDTRKKYLAVKDYLRELAKSGRNVDEFILKEAIVTNLSLPQKAANALIKEFKDVNGEYKEKEKVEENLEEEGEQEFGDDIKKKALTLLKDPKFLLKVKEFLEKHGKVNGHAKKVIVGEGTNKILLFCIGLSAKYRRKINAIIQGASSSGKSRLLYLLLLLFKGDVVDLFRVSERAIDYLDMDLDGKILVIKEMEGGKSAIYSIKIVIDPESDRLTILTVEKDPETNAQISVEKSVRGHPIFVSTTTSIRIDPELKNRIFLIASDESEEQTKKIAEADDEERRGFFPDITDELNVFTCAILMLRPLQVKIPFSIKYPTKNVKSRRSRAHLLDLIEVVAFAHQYQRDIIRVRETDGQENEYIIATPGDFAVAYEMAKKTIERDIQSVHPKALELFELFKKRGVGDDDEKVGFTLRRVRELSPEYLGRSYSKTFLRGSLDELDDANYIVSDSGKPKKWYIFDEENGGESAKIESVHVSQPFGEAELRAWVDGLITTDTDGKDKLIFSLSHHVCSPFTGEKKYLLNPECSLCSSKPETGTPSDKQNENGEHTLSQSDDFPSSFADSADEIEDLEANYNEHYKYEGVGKCPKCGNERGLFENPRNKDENLCAVCLQRAIKEECDRSVESVSIDGVPEANIEENGGVLG